MAHEDVTKCNVFCFCFFSPTKVSPGFAQRLSGMSGVSWEVLEECDPL